MDAYKMIKYPTLIEAKNIAIDTETHDPNLRTHGAGWATGDGKILGVSVAVDGWKKYFPIRHTRGGNEDVDTFRRWFKEQVCETKATKIFHNANYDVGWIKQDLGLDIQGPLVDTMLAESLINEHKDKIHGMSSKPYSLGFMAPEYLGVQKQNTVLEDYCDRNGIKWKRDVRSVIHKIPSNIVGAYAEDDADQTLRIWGKQQEEIKRQELEQITQLEFDLIRLFVKMRFKGVRVDISRAEHVARTLRAKEEMLQAQIDSIAGMEVNVHAPKSMLKAYETNGFPYGKTSRGNPSFAEPVLSGLSDPLSPLVLKLRSYTKVRKDFVEGVVLQKSRHGRIYAQINQLKADENGTISGRLSYSMPNLQQMPARDPELGPLMRSLFIAEDGCLFGSFDYSQQEPRLGIHYASITNCQGAQDAVDYFQEEEADYHNMICELIRDDFNDMPKDDKKEFRSKNKEVTLGKSYGMGFDKLRAKLNMSEAEAREFINKYNECVPYVKELSDHCMNTVSFRALEEDRTGWLRTLLGRKCRFPLWEPSGLNYKQRQQVKPLPWDKFVEAQRDPNNPNFYGRSPKLAFAYTAYNKLMQSSSADQTKMAMKLCDEAGLVPCLQVHDELNDSGLESEKQAHQYSDIMREAVKLRVPSKVSVGIGPSWAEAK
jgi:DNA polymerase-1